MGLCDRAVYLQNGVCDSLLRLIPVVLAAARMANCGEFAEKLPDGWNALSGVNGSELSGGVREPEDNNQLQRPGPGQSGGLADFHISQRPRAI